MKLASALFLLTILFGCSTEGGSGGSATTGSILNQSTSLTQVGGTSQTPPPPGGTVLPTVLTNFFATPNQTFGVTLVFSELGASNVNSSNLIAQNDVVLAGIRGMPGGGPYNSIHFTYGVGPSSQAPNRQIEGDLYAINSLLVGAHFPVGGGTFDTRNLFYREAGGRTWRATGGVIVLEELIPPRDQPPAIGAARLRLEGIRFTSDSVGAQGSFTMNGVLRLDLASYTFTQGQGFTATFSPPFDYPANLPRP